MGRSEPLLGEGDGEGIILCFRGETTGLREERGIQNPSSYFEISERGGDARTSAGTSGESPGSRMRLGEFERTNE